jgi:hypothetical protein
MSESITVNNLIFLRIFPYVVELMYLVRDMNESGKTTESVCHFRNSNPDAKPNIKLVQERGEGHDQVVYRRLIVGMVELLPN